MDFIDIEKLEEVKSRILENTHTRADLLDLLDLLDNVQDKVDDLENYIYEEIELNTSSVDDNGIVL